MGALVAYCGVATRPDQRSSLSSGDRHRRGREIESRLRRKWQLVGCHGGDVFGEVVVVDAVELQCAVLVGERIALLHVRARPLHVRSGGLVIVMIGQDLVGDDATEASAKRKDHGGRKLHCRFLCQNGLFVAQCGLEVEKQLFPHFKPRQAFPH
ncbi:MAG: hypothetical protein A2534_04290 [Candidatus Magasanikbacteria bacterium RIFOXYD2_FULL_39_9]|uniref:Uncharacterized protein n=1 Tax=Candidatus Magasanikbacteria bacterium RIFOXYD1_FULL_40_23 TaxID=1798705 RepID=A0A1F6PB59_9BACT|nr:MAG: hypothetical protein A2534_04290 [Candidatus Magasanikbacteria bacterium RIFOXYD2_FULL_39_9]OGH93407.1 MAG: hypothetical protein A2563_02250 [Candidatus Magasanikbacteria bacterium RIFOXYD1_FULL_40_23]